MKHNFCAFILTHGRPDNVKTYEKLIRHGYTGDIYIVIDTDDKKASEYLNRFGEKVIIFDKEKISKTFDEADNFENRKAIVYARNVCWELALSMGYDYFVELDDDYNWFGYRTVNGSKPIESLDNIFDLLIDYLDSANLSSIALSQGGDHIGGYDPKKKISRKCMNSFICKTNNRFLFQGRINEDVNTYTNLASRGALFFTIMNIQLNQETTQKSSGGMSEIYLESGTYIKSFYTILFQPSSVKIRTMGKTNRRLHHSIDWGKTVPKIIREEFKK